MSIIIFTDGGSRGNPGHAGAGGVIMENYTEKILAEVSVYLGKQTNNYAEYSSLILTLEKAIELGLTRESIKVAMDSKLVISQINGIWKVKHPNIIPLYNRAKELIAQFNNIVFGHINRERNSLADALANKAMDSIKNDISIKNGNNSLNL